MVSVRLHEMKMCSVQRRLALHKYTETTEFDPTSLMNGGGLRYHRNAKRAHTALCSTTVMKWGWSVPHFYWSSLSTRWTSMYHSTNASTYQDDIQFSVLQTHHMWEKINAHKLDLSDGANTNTYVSWHHEGECCIIVRAGMANCVQASLSMLNTIFQLSKCHDYKNIYIWLRDTSLEIHKSRLMFCSLTCVFARVCSEWMNGVWGVTEFNLLSLICQSLRKQDWLVPAFPKYDFPIFFSHNAKVSLLKNVKWSC